jgi:hypothetical protein
MLKKRSFQGATIRRSQCEARQAGNISVYEIEGVVHVEETILPRRNHPQKSVLNESARKRRTNLRTVTSRTSESVLRLEGSFQSI